MSPTHRVFSATLLLVAPLPAQLAGVYTVNPLLPATAANFTSLTAAVNALNTYGVAGPVFIDVYIDYH